MFKSELTAQFIIAHGSELPGHLSHERAPSSIKQKNLSFNCNTPSFNGAYLVEGNAISHADINSNECVLYRDLKHNNDFKPKDIIVLNAKTMHPQSNIHKDWKTLRVVESIGAFNTAAVSSMVDGKKVIETILAEDVSGVIVYAFTPDSPMEHVFSK